MNLQSFASPAVWMDGEATGQVARAAALPGCIRAAAMPDLHAGPGGLPIGVALGFGDRIVPGLLGSDVGCGARLVVTTARPPGLDLLERRLRAGALIEERPWDGDAEMIDALLGAGLPGLAAVATVPPRLARLLALAPPVGPIDGATLDGEMTAAHLAASLGTIGGGNHFGELAVVDEILDPEIAAAHAITRGKLAVLVHTGSRALGALVAERFGHDVIPVAGAAPFLAAQAWACRFAEANRALLAGALLAAAGTDRPEKIAATVDCAHNAVSPLALRGETIWVHRKGAAPAAAGQLTLMLGSRGAPSYLMLGLGREDALCSVPHGAGRRYHRADALAKMRAKHSRASLQRTSLGGRILCDRTALLYEEHPDVYKPIGPVLSSVVEGGLARPVAALRPLVTVKL